MKKFMIFIISFVFLFLILQIGSGMILTALSPPDMTGAWDESAVLPQEITVSNGYQPAAVTMSAALIAAMTAYFIQKKSFNNTTHIRR